MVTNNSVLNRVLGTGASASDKLGLYKDSSGNMTTCRPEFAGQTVQLGNQYVTYNAEGYPTTAMSVEHARELGNDYTMEHLGLDQTKIVNAGDIYRAIYNAAMEKASTVSGSKLDNAYNKRNIQYDGALGAEDYDTLIREAVAAGNHVLAGFYEDSRNALIADKGLSPSLQSSTYNGGWNYVDNSGGAASVPGGARAVSGQADRTESGWYAGEGKGEVEKEYIYRNFDTPSVEEVAEYAAAHGLAADNENDMEKAMLQMMAEGYVSEESLRRAEALKAVLPLVLGRLGLNIENATDALDAAESV